MKSGWKSVYFWVLFAAALAGNALVLKMAPPRAAILLFSAQLVWAVWQLACMVISVRAPGAHDERSPSGTEDSAGSQS